ncbi:MAG: DNA-protecting protein DprA [Alphaproteobacteria bacterium]|nr:DNA-protecting protein DprA [Alphaproteobacteria bacterium]
MSDLYEKLLILRTPGIGPVRFRDLINRFGSPRAVVDAIGVNTAHIDTVRREMDTAQNLGIQYICDDDAAYPVTLRAVHNHPPVISVRGNINALCRPIISIVGTRHATGVGMRFVAQIACEFAAHGFTVASGMAIGTDTAAHRGALTAHGDNPVTIAVLAGGADYIWPTENESLYHQILERGAIISEMPVGFVPVATNFIQRNRWVAGLGEKLILGEADMNSGSMTTARFAAEYGREIWAIPSHPADSRGAGPNSLIANGMAHLCMGVSDFFHDEKNASKNKKSEKKSESENSVLDALGIIPLSESVLAQIVKKTISEIKRELVILELQGLIRKTDGGYVRV